MSSLKRGQENQFRFGHFRVQTAGQVLSPFLFASLQLCLSVDLPPPDPTVSLHSHIAWLCAQEMQCVKNVASPCESQFMGKTEKGFVLR